MKGHVMRQFIRSEFLAVMVGASLLGAVTAQQSVGPEPAEWTEEAIIPVLSRAMDGPQFAVDYRNDSDSVQDLTDVLGSSSIVLDNVKYDCHSVKFVGNPNLPPTRTHTFKISLGTYLPREGYEKKAYSEKLKRWRWQTPLEAGRHTLSVEIGAKQYGPITFVWDPSSPLLYE
jgi:hypothetical protein